MHEVLESELVNVEFTLQLGSGSVRSVIPVPSGQATITDLLPIIQNFTSSIAQHAAGSMAQQGRPVTCGPKCTACCHQLVPISTCEAEGLARWIRSLPEEQQHGLAARFYRAIVSLQERGVLAKLNPEMFELASQEFRQLGDEYTAAAVPCPFLQEGNCSIYPIRPLICREYMVVSPPAYCSEPGLVRAEVVSMPLKPSTALRKLSRSSSGTQPWLPLVFLFHWMKAGEQDAPNVAGTGPEVLKQFVQALAGKSEAGAVPAPA